MWTFDLPLNLSDFIHDLTSTDLIRAILRHCGRQTSYSAVLAATSGLDSLRTFAEHLSRSAVR
jgi:hypothetical protein